MANIPISITYPDGKQADILQYAIPELELYLQSIGVDFSGMNNKQKIAAWVRSGMHNFYKQGRRKEASEQASETLKTNLEATKTFIDDLSVD